MDIASILRILYYLFIFTLIPSDFLHAWGPLTHIAIANEVVKLLAPLALPAVETILKYRREFLFGNVYADVIIAKNLVEYREHSHNWETGVRILSKARTGEEKSFAYGYLSHLAADCIAHNYYVPRYLVLSFKKIFMKHTYWEMRYDNMFHDSTWKIAISLPFLVKRPLELLLKNNLVKPLFTFETHRGIFNGLLFLQGIKQWRNAIEKNSRRNGIVISTNDRDLFYRSSINLILDFIKNYDSSNAISLDPTGRANLKKARYLRKILRNKQPHTSEVESLAKRFLPDF